MAMGVGQIESKYGITAEKLDEIDENACLGELPGEAGRVVAGRPLKFGKKLKLVAYKELPETVEAIDSRAAALGLTRSDYLRNLVRQDLAHA